MNVNVNVHLFLMIVLKKLHQRAAYQEKEKKSNPIRAVRVTLIQVGKINSKIKKTKK